MAAQSNAGKRSKGRNKFATVAWVVAGLIAAVVAANVIDSEYDLGIFDQPAVAAGGSDSATMASSTTTTTSSTTTTTTTPSTTTTRATTTTAPPATTAELVGWFEDSCVAFDGDFVEPISCDDPYDAVIVAVTGVEDNCPMATDWVVELEPRVACLDEESLASTTATFPPGIASLEQGSPTWAVVLASGSSMEDAHLQQVVDTAEKAGYLTSPTDCDFGAAEALEAPSGHFTVSVYFSDKSDAVEARESFASLGLVGAVAEVETYCLD